MSIQPGDEKLKCLYKYRKLAGDGPDGLNINTFNLLEKGEIYFSKPDAFNDPFDSKIDYDTTATVEEIGNYLDRVGVDRQKKEIVLGKIRSGQLDRNQFLSGDSSAHANPLNIFCLAKTPTNILMWSHYCKNHTGICIGFKVHIVGESLNIKVDPNQITPLFTGQVSDLIPAVYIEYHDAKPKPYNLFKGNQDDLSAFLRQKSKYWEYEQELRLLIIDRHLLKNPVIVPKAEILEITFGLRSGPKLIKKVRDIVGGAGYPNAGKDVKFYQCIEIPGQYAIGRKVL